MMNVRRLLEFKKFVRSRVFGKFAGIAKDITGIDFHGLKEYEPGDSPSDINRAATRQHGERLVNQRMPDRQLMLVLVVDTTVSMLFGEKEERLVALLQLGYDVAREHRTAYVLTFPRQTASGVHKKMHHVPRVVSGDTEEYFRALLREQTNVSSGAFCLGDSFGDIRKWRRQTVFVVVVSDFLFDADYDDDMYGFLRTGYTTLVALAILDSAEVALPKLTFGALRARDSETGRTALIARSPSHCLEAHKALWKKHRATLEVVQI